MNAHTDRENGRFVTLSDQSLRCADCGHEWTGTVEVDTLPGVACATCPECNEVGEPLPQRGDAE